MGDLLRINPKIIPNRSVPWVLKAMSSDPARMVLTGFGIVEDKKVKGRKWLAATDGRRLHQCVFEQDTKPGAYTIISKNSKEIIAESNELSWPNIWCVIPEFEEKPIKFVAEGNLDNLLCIYGDIRDQTKVLLGAKLFGDALSGFSMGWMHNSGATNAVMITDDQKYIEKTSQLAVIMPRRKD